MSLKPSDRALDRAYAVLPPNDMLYGNYLPDISKDEIKVAIQTAFKTDITIDNKEMWKELVNQLYCVKSVHAANLITSISEFLI